MSRSQTSLVARVLRGIRIRRIRSKIVDAELVCAVVAQRDEAVAPIIAERFPGWIVLHPGDPFVHGQTFDRVVVLMAGGMPVGVEEYEKEAVWLNELRQYLRPGVELEIAV